MLALMLDPDPHKRPSIEECMKGTDEFIQQEEELLIMKPNGVVVIRDRPIPFNQEVDDLFTDHGVVKFEKAASWEAQSIILSRLLESQQSIGSLYLRTPGTVKSIQKNYLGQLLIERQNENHAKQMVSEGSGMYFVKLPSSRLESKTPQSIRASSSQNAHDTGGFSHQLDVKTAIRNSEPHSVEFGTNRSPGEPTARRSLRIPSGFQQAHLKGKFSAQTDVQEDDQNTTLLEKGNWVTGKPRFLKNSQSSLRRFSGLSAVPTHPQNRQTGGLIPKRPVATVSRKPGADIRPTSYPHPLAQTNEDDPEDPAPEEI